MSLNIMPKNLAQSFHTFTLGESYVIYLLSLMWLGLKLYVVSRKAYQAFFLALVSVFCSFLFSQIPGKMTLHYLYRFLANDVCMCLKWAQGGLLGPVGPH
jgi:hypothetical protein